MTTILSTTTEQTPLPDGWRWARLGEVIREAQAGFARGERDPNGVIQLRMNNVTTSGTFDWSSFLRVPADAETIAFYRLTPGDVLFNNTNSTELVGKAALFESHEESVVYSNHFTRLRATNDLEPRFLSLWLQDQWRRGVFADICNRWIGQSAVKNDKLLALQIPLPPLPEQRRIAARLNEIMAEIARARAAAQNALDAANALPSALLRAVFESDEAKRWERRHLSDICEINPSRVGKTGFPDKMLVTFVPMSGVDDVKGEVVSPEIRPYGDVKKGYTWFLNSYVLWTKITPCMQNGKAFVASELENGVGLGSTEFHVLRPKTNVVPEWLWFYVRREEFRNKAKETFTGAVGQQRVPESFLYDQDILVPPIEEQRRIADHVLAEIDSANRLRGAAQAQLHAINALPAVYLRRAFRGELWPADDGRLGLEEEQIYLPLGYRAIGNRCTPLQCPPARTNSNAPPAAYLWRAFRGEL